MTQTNEPSVSGAGDESPVAGGDGLGIVEQRVAVGDCEISVARTSGDAPPLVMLHGVTRCWQSFLPLIPALASRWRVHALDFRGHGASDRVPGGYRVVDYVPDVVSYLRESLDQPVVLYGHSLGAMVAAAVAAACRDRVRGLIMEDPPFDAMGSRIGQSRPHGFFASLYPLAGSEATLREVAASLAEINLCDPGSDVSVRLGDVRSSTSLRLSAWGLSRLDPTVLDPIVQGRWLDGLVWRSMLERVDCPTLLFQADPDAGGMLADDNRSDAEELIGDLSLVPFPESDHLLHWGRTQDIVNHTLAFLETVPRVPTSSPCSLQQGTSR
ncbi:Tropinesterase [Planctomycetes bacterium Pan216]|uniref:Tropinesterase n=1 Tax=Kolteria novifilia TaxID=2527975 RepID=A0A518AYQ1_9BACT|nr:Tropinesterase [Planctomycetes bacterium Pan216]